MTPLVAIAPAPDRSAAATPGHALAVRPATDGDAPAIHALIAAHQEEGRLLARALDEITAHAPRFLVAEEQGRIVACADLAPLSRRVAEVRSLVVSEAARSRGAGRQLIDALVARAAGAGFEQLCAFTHAAGYFVHLGFSLVPHVWLPEKIAADCHRCPEFQRCGQHAVVLPLARRAHSCVPLSSLHG